MGGCLGAVWVIGFSGCGVLVGCLGCFLVKEGYFRLGMGRDTKPYIIIYACGGGGEVSMGAFGLVLFGVLPKMFGYGLCRSLKMRATIVMKSLEGLTNVGEADTM